VLEIPIYPRQHPYMHVFLPESSLSPHARIDQAGRGNSRRALSKSAVAEVAAQSVARGPLAIQPAMSTVVRGEMADIDAFAEHQARAEACVLIPPVK